jgi:hemerythrin
MHETTWASETMSGVPELDQLHRNLFAALDRLASATDEDFCAGYDDFVSQLEHAFRMEEEWMDDIDFPVFKVHQEQHARVLGGLHATHGRIEEGDVKLGREVVEKLLPQWFALHISTMDEALALAMQVAQAEAVLPAAYGNTQATTPYALTP